MESKRMKLKQSEVNTVEKTNYYRLIYLVDYSKHCLYCLFARPDFTCYWEQSDLEEFRFTAMDCYIGFLKSCFLDLPTLWLQYIKC